MKKIVALILIQLLLLTIASGWSKEARVAATVFDLRCEGRSNPLGVDVSSPRLSWMIGNEEEKAESGKRKSETVHSKSNEAESGNAEHSRQESGKRKAEMPRGLKQTAYQIRVASTPENMAQNRGDLWDSGKVKSDQQTQVSYAGKPLASSQPVFW